MKVFFVTNSLSGGGAERATNTLVNALHSIGLDVSLITLNGGINDLVEPKRPVFNFELE